MGNRCVRRVSVTGVVINTVKHRIRKSKYPYKHMAVGECITMVRGGDANYCEWNGVWWRYHNLAMDNARRKYGMEFRVDGDGRVTVWVTRVK